MRSTNSCKVAWGKILVLLLSFSLFLITIVGVSSFKNTNLNLKNNANTNVALNGNQNQINKRNLNFDSYVQNAWLVADNPTIQVKLNVILPGINGQGFVPISFDKSRIDMYKGTNSIAHKTSGNCEYFNIGLNSDNISNTEPGIWNQYINLISNGKYIWESGFSLDFDVMQEIVKATVFSNTNLDLSETLYLNFTQKGNGKFERNLEQKWYYQSFDSYYWELTNQQYTTLPQNNTVVFNDTISNSYNPIASYITCTESVPVNYIKTQTFQCTDGISFSLAIDPLSTKVNSLDLGECNLYTYLTWIRNLSQSNGQNSISYGYQTTPSDAIVVNQSQYLDDVASQYADINSLQLYKGSINGQLARNGFASTLWEISSVNNLDDSKLDPELLNAINKVIEEKKITPFDDKTGIFYKLIKLDNAFYLGKEARVNPTIPWLYYVCDVANEPLASYYIVKFEAIKKIYSISDLNYDFGLRKFYLDTSGVNFENLKQQNINWPSRVYFDYNHEQWINKFNSNLNLTSSISLPLYLSNTKNVPFAFDYASQNITVELYDGLVQLLSESNIDLKKYGVSSWNDIAIKIANGSISFVLNNKITGVNNIATKQSIDVTTTSILSVSIGLVLIGIIVGVVFVLNKKKMDINKQKLVHNTPRKPIATKPIKPTKPIVPKPKISTSVQEINTNSNKGLVLKGKNNVENNVVNE